MKQPAAKLFPWLMIFGVLALYLLLPTKNYYWDGIDFAQVIEDAQSFDATLIHPNHLLYNFFGYAIYRALRLGGSQLRALAALQFINSVASVISAWVFFRILLSCLKSAYLGYALTLLFSCSAIWWKFSTDADSYILSVLFILISFNLILPARQPRPLLVAATHTLSLLFHQLAIFFSPALLLGLFFQSSALPARRRVVVLVQYAVAVGLLTSAAFSLSFYLQTGSFNLSSFARWLTNYSPEHGFSIDLWGNFFYTLRGHARLFLGGRLTLLRGLMSPLIIMLGGALVAGFIALGYLLLRHLDELKLFFRSAFKRDSGFGKIRLLALAWIAPYVAFLFFFIPQNTFYRLFYFPAVILLGGTLLASYETQPAHVRRYRVALFVAVMALSNLLFFVFPYAHAPNNPPLTLALSMSEAWPRGTVIYNATPSTDARLSAYFNPGTHWRKLPPSLNLIHFEREVQDIQRSGAAVWLETSAADFIRSLPDGPAWLNQHTIAQPQHQLVNDKYRLSFIQIK